MLRECLIFVVIFNCVSAQYNPHFEEGSFGIVHLFEWHWDTIADECENFFGPNKIGGIQISPPNENLIITDRPWWERYQPLSYILSTRSGDRDAFVDMVERCNNAGVRIYADIVINHMCGANSQGVGTAGTSDFNSDPSNPSFPDIPYYASDFNPASSCPTESGIIEDPSDQVQLRNCRLFDLLDLNQGIGTVRDTIISYLNELLGIGVAGFRIDAARHMWPEDLAYIYHSLNNLNREPFGPAQRAYIYQEVIEDAGTNGLADEYTGIGSVTEFDYGTKIFENKDSLESLRHFTDDMITSTQALAFLNNHDNQRGHGNEDEVVSFQDPYNLKILTAFMLAWPYGIPRVMSSYYFSDSDQGPPPNQRGLTDVGTCTNGWVCEHRWRPIKNMFAFGNVVKDSSTIDNWWANNTNQIAFSRGERGFIAINKAGIDMDVVLQTSLPEGSYCNVFDGDYSNGECTGECISVDSAGNATIVISGSDPNPVIAIHVNATTTSCNTGEEDTEYCSDCTCSEKYFCGHVGLEQDECEQQGCLWCMTNNTTENTCVMSKSDSGTQTCDVEESERQACQGDNEYPAGCSTASCCWLESPDSSVPSCYYPA